MEIITITNNYLGQYVNSFVARTASADIFIDAGLYWNRAAYEPFFRSGRERNYLSTHGHWDHIGMAGVFRARGAPLHGHAGDARFYADYSWHWHYIFGRYGGAVAIPPERAPMFRDSLDAPVEIDVPLADGQTLAVDGAEFGIIHTPGHSPGSVCIHERKSGALFTGVVSLFIRGEHLIVDILSIHYSPGLRRIARIVNDLIALAVSGCLLLFGFRLCINPMILDTVTIAMEISPVWMYILLPPSMLLILIFSVLDLYQVFTGTADSQAVMEGGE